MMWPLRRRRSEDWEFAAAANKKDATETRKTREIRAMNRTFRRIEKCGVEFTPMRVAMGIMC